MQDSGDTSLSVAIKLFLKVYPKGFRDRNFIEIDNIRQYKLEAHQYFTSHLSKRTFRTLLQKNDYNEIISRCLMVVDKTNLLHWIGKSNFKKAFNSPKNKRDFCKVFFDVLFNPDEMREKSFKGYFDYFARTGNAGWPVATYLLFMYYPEEYILLKPAITKKASRALGFQINYQSKLNWLTYSSVLAMARHLKRETLKKLKPRDMIDIHAFLWWTWGRDEKI